MGDINGTLLGTGRGTSSEKCACTDFVGCTVRAKSRMGCQSVLAMPPAGSSAFNLLGWVGGSNSNSCVPLVCNLDELGNETMAARTGSSHWAK
eukprot:1930292-Amphidinium_carterae.1